VSDIFLQNELLSMQKKENKRVSEHQLFWGAGKKTAFF
jgi:hypothetical protein